MDLVLAERVGMTTSQVYIMPRELCMQKVAQDDNRHEIAKEIPDVSPLEAALGEELAKGPRLGGWHLRSNAPRIPREKFYNQIPACTLQEPRYPWLPVLTDGSLFDRTASKRIDAFNEKILPLIEEEAKPRFLEGAKIMGEVLDGLSRVSGNLYLMEFTPEKGRGDAERILFLANKAPRLDEEGVLLLDKKPVSRREVYGCAQVKAPMFYHNQDGRRDIARKGEISIECVGTFESYRNAFASWGEIYGTQLRLMKCE